MKETLKADIKEIGRTGDEDISGLLAVNMFHTVFSAYDKRLYATWFKENHEELAAETENPFFNETLKGALDQLETVYKEEHVTLTKKRFIQELKRGLHAKLFSVGELVDNTLERVASIKAKGKRSSDEVADDLECIMKQAYQVERQVDELIKSIVKLDYSTNDLY
jgi:hypothetical protein